MPFSEFTGNQPDEWWKLETWWEKPPGITGKPLRPEVLLRQVAPNTFQLVRGFDYALPQDDPGARVTFARRLLWHLERLFRAVPPPDAGSHGPWNVPPHDLRSHPEAPENSTDLASVPPWLWWFVASHGKHSRAALLHDHLIGNQTPGTTDRQADHAFRAALRESEVPILRRWLMWDAVSLASLWRRGLGKVAVVVFAAYLAAFTAALAYAITTSWGWLGDALAWPFVQIWRVLEPVVELVTRGVTWLWTSLEWILPASLETPWWKVALIGLAGLLFWRKRWLITLAGLALIVLPTVAVFSSYALSFVAEGALWLVAKGVSSLPRVEVDVESRPVAGRTARTEVGRM